MEKILHCCGFGRKGFAIEIDKAFFPTHTAEVDELETVPLCPNLSISERNLAFMWVCGNSRIQLESFLVQIIPPSIRLRIGLPRPSAG